MPSFFHADNEDSDQTVDVQPDLSLHCAHLSEGTFSRVAAHIELSHQIRKYKACLISSSSATT